jgi:polyhydroxyalkanoate synthesis regulator phasin
MDEPAETSTSGPSSETGGSDDRRQDDTLRGLALGALGALGLTPEREEDVRSWIEDASTRWRGDAVRVGERAGSTLQSVLRELGLVTRDEYDELELRVAQLEHRLRLVENEPPPQ